MTKLVRASIEELTGRVSSGGIVQVPAFDSGLIPAPQEDRSGFFVCWTKHPVQRLEHARRTFMRDRIIKRLAVSA